MATKKPASKKALATAGKNMPAQSVPASQGAQLLVMIEKLAQNPEVDVDKMEKIMDMQERMIDKDAQQQYNADMVKAQMAMPIVPEDANNNQTSSTYSKYETVLKYTKPIYTEHGFCVSFYEGAGAPEGEIRVMGKVMHRAGHSEVVFVDVPLDNKGIKGSVNKTNTHAKGSSLSYGKGYLLKMIFNIATGDDDDGQAAGGEIAEIITEEEADDIRKRLKEGGVDLARFERFLKKEINCLGIGNIYRKSLDYVNGQIETAIKAQEKNNG